MRPSQVLSHPTWGTAVYPATLFAKAPLDVLKAAIERAGRAGEGGDTPATVVSAPSELEAGASSSSTATAASLSTSS